MLNLSYLKLFIGVFFALFILSACGGGGGDAPAAAAAAPTITSCADANQHVVDNVCTNYTSQTCVADGKFFDSTDTCVTKLTVSECVGYNGVDATTNECAAYADTTECTTAGYKAYDVSAATGCTAFTSTMECTDAGYKADDASALSGCTAYTPDECKQTQGKKFAIYKCDADYVATEAGFYENTEYSKSGVLESVNAAAAYANIQTLINDSVANVKQGGEGQIISIWSNLNPAASQGYDDGYMGLADTTNPVFVDGYETLLGGTTNIGVCTTDTCRTYSFSTNTTHSLNGLAGRREGTGIHGIAYNAQIKMLTYGGNLPSQTEINDGLAQGGTTSGQNIVAMIHQRLIAAETSSLNGKYYDLPRDSISNSELAGTKAVVDAGTMIISHAGAHGANSVNGMMTYYTTVVKKANQTDGVKQSATDFYGSAAAANIANYAANVTNDDYKGSWIVAVGVDANNVIHSTSNSCGSTKQYCLSVPEIASANNDGTMLAVNPSYTLAGAIAVMKGAYPNLASTQLISLALGTADYIDNSEGEVDSATDGKYNAVYGHGLLNLGAATSLSETDASNANIISSSASPIGAIWGDTKLTLSSHFGNGLDSVNLGVQDKYGRHFILDAPQTSYAPVAVSLDDYMANMLGDDSQSQTLGTQAKLNYSNSGETWMNLEYASGKATTKIAFQDSYKINPLSDTGTTTILRANNIRPASSNIGMMDVDYKLGNLTLSSYVARGEYDTGYKFDELGTDFEVNYKDSHLNIAIGNIREHGQFLGTNTSGAYALNAPTVSRFTDVTYGHDIGAKFNIYANYINYETDVDMLHDQFASIDGLQADQYQIGFTGKDLISKDDSLNVALITKLGVTDGALNQNTVLGYTADGAFNNASQSYDLAVSNRHQQFEITYQGKLYQNADKISNFRDNRFFTSIIVDQNLNHVQGAWQTEIISGINVRY